jgi:hypothetical protein
MATHLHGFGWQHIVVGGTAADSMTGGPNQQWQFVDMGAATTAS